MLHRASRVTSEEREREKELSHKKLQPKALLGPLTEQRNEQIPEES